MAFNLQTFRTRALTAIVFVIMMLTGLLWNQWSFLILFSIIHFGCWWEYLRLTEKIHTTRFHVYTKLGLMVMGYGLVLFFCDPVLYQINSYSFNENFSLPVSAAGFSLLLIGIFQKNRISIKGFIMLILGLLYISFTIGLLIDLTSPITRQDSGEPIFRYHNFVFPCLIIFSLWINDTMAYIVGSLIGKRSLSVISPKKTWEGTIGGVLLTGIAAFLISFFLIKNSYVVDVGNVPLTALVVAVAGTTGDLVESKLKRMAGVKDSGAIMPGHGGFMDRFDSLLFAIPVAWFLLKPCLMGQC